MVELKHWQAVAVAKFLLAAAKGMYGRVVAINVKKESEGVAFEAITMDGRVATLRVIADGRHLVMCIDEWGLMAELE
jgi:hypothetical protein